MARRSSRIDILSLRQIIPGTRDSWTTPPEWVEFETAIKFLQIGPGAVRGSKNHEKMNRQREESRPPCHQKITLLHTVPEYWPAVSQIKKSQPQVFRINCSKTWLACTVSSLIPMSIRKNWKPYGLCHTMFCRPRCFRPPYQPPGEADTQEGTHLYFLCQPQTLYQAPPFLHNPEAADSRTAENAIDFTLCPCGGRHGKAFCLSFLSKGFDLYNEIRDDRG